MGSSRRSLILLIPFSRLKTKEWHRLQICNRFSNPQFKPEEVAYQLTTAKVTFMVVHSSVLGIVLSAARLVGFPLDRITLLDQSSTSNASSMINSVPELISIGRQKPRAFYERPLDQGEGKTKIALLCWSSGTTGKPKVVLFKPISTGIFL